jgi:hypothetical protein
VSAIEKPAVEQHVASARSRAIVLVPLLGFLGLAALFVFRLGAGDPTRIPLALIGHPAPALRSSQGSGHRPITVMQHAIYVASASGLGPF